MKYAFGSHFTKYNRLIVIHHCQLICDKIISVLQNNDILFFDDCLYSQYVFLKQYNNILKEKDIICVLGFSAALHRLDKDNPIYDIESHVIHNKCNQFIKTYKDVETNYFEELNGFMHLDEIKELLQEDNIYLACHGSCHLDFRNTTDTNLVNIIKFKKDLDDAVNLFKFHKLIANIYVYPYAYSLNNLFEPCIKQQNFIYIFANDKLHGSRISIEDLL